METRQVAFGTTTIPYAVRRSARTKTVAVAVDPEDGVVLTAPQRAEVPQLDAIVRRKALWIIERLRRQSELPPPPGAREFVSGECFLYLGRQYRLRVVDADAPERTLLERGFLEVRLARGLDRDERVARVRVLLTGWYRSRAAERLPGVLAAWATKAQVTPPALRIVSQTRRWGSCTASGVVRLNWRVVGASTRVIEYVVAHELTHLRHENHTAAFWAALGRTMPDYESRREQLRRVGRRLTW